ncbi:MAG: beta-eliminating lyase-related protein, partial [Acidobacteriota bacterium]
RTAVPACVSLTQATEAGTIYQPDEVRELCAVAHRGETLVHMDGARFANAVASLGAGHSPADLTWRAGVDILVLGGTKNGAMAAELLVVFGRDLVEPLSIRWHRAGHRLSKMRFLSAQLEAYLTDDLWLRNARHANEAAAAIAGGMATISRVEIVRPVEANVVFVRLDPAINASLQSSGFQFYDWPPYGKDVVRIVTGFATTTDDVNGLLAATRAASERVEGRGQKAEVNLPGID